MAIPAGFKLAPEPAQQPQPIQAAPPLAPPPPQPAAAPASNIPTGFKLAEPVEPPEKPGIADLFTGASRTTPELEALPEIGNAPELNALSVPAFKSSLGLLTTSDDKASRDVLTKQFGDEVNFTQDAKGNTIVNFPSGQFALNKPGFSGPDLIKGAFDIASFSPAAKAGSAVKSVIASGGTEGLLETLEASLGGEFNPSEIVMSGLLGGFFKGAEDLIGAGFRAVKGRLASNVIEAGADAGIPVLTSDVLENQTPIRKLVSESFEKIPFSGTGGDRVKQQVARATAVNDVAERYGQFSYTAIIDSLKTQKSKVKNAAGNVLEETGRKLDEFGEIPLKHTEAAIDRAKTQLVKQGVIESTPATRDLNTLIAATNSARQSFTTLKENRTAFSEIIKGADKAERSQLSSRAKTLLEGVEKAMKKDMTALAKAELTPREFTKWNRANQLYFEEAQKLTKSRLKNVLDKGDVTPESVKTLLFSKNRSELKLLFQSLTTDGRANARAAIVNDVIDTLARRQGGLTPNTFATEMKKRGLSTKEFFRGEERKQLDGLLDVLNATRRAQDAGVTTPTGQSLLVPGSIGTLVGGGPVGGALAIAATLSVGTIGRVYESPPVRNALIRLANTPKGSTAFEKTLQEAIQAITVASQTAREQIGNE